MWDLPGQGIEPMSPALAGEFFTTEPLGVVIVVATASVPFPQPRWPPETFHCHPGG